MRSEEQSAQKEHEQLVVRAQLEAERRAEAIVRENRFKTAEQVLADARKEGVEELQANLRAHFRAGPRDRLVPAPIGHEDGGFTCTSDSCVNVPTLCTRQRALTTARRLGARPTA